MAESTQQKRVRSRAKAKSDTGSSVTQPSSDSKRKASAALPLDEGVLCIIYSSRSFDLYKSPYARHDN